MHFMIQKKKKVSQICALKTALYILLKENWIFLAKVVPVSLHHGYIMSSLSDFKILKQL